MGQHCVICEGIPVPAAILCKTKVRIDAASLDLPLVNKHKTQRVVSGRRKERKHVKVGLYSVAVCLTICLSASQFQGVGGGGAPGFGRITRFLV